MSRDGSIRAIAASTTNLVAQICSLQGTDPTATVALGRMVSATCLMGSLLKGAQRLALTIEANGPLQKLQAETDAYGAVRATIKQPVCNLPPKNDNFDVANAIGKAGFLHVIKDLGLKEPYHGTVQLVTSEIGEDIAHYFAVSEQIPTSLALGVTLDSQAGVAASGGLLIQALPGGKDEILKRVEGALQGLKPVSTMLRAGYTPMAILEQVLLGVPFDLQSSYELTFNCSCSRPYVVKMLSRLPPEEQSALVQCQEDTVVTCEYCKHEYRFTPTDLSEFFS
jgi:molecular chaperone Hsp33